MTKKIDGLYVATYGIKSDPAIIFIHGGPGYDSQDFELTTAALLAAKGFYVVVYDERGQGRSEVAKTPTDYTYQRYADDLNSIIVQLGLNKPTLIGHSHGGPISLKFDRYYPGVASRIILVSGPVDFFRTLDSMRINCNSRYSATNDISNTKKLANDFSTLRGTPNLKDEINAVSDVFKLGMSKPCDLYTPSHPTQSAIALHQSVTNSRIKIPQENLFYPMSNFIVNEQYIHVDQTQWMKDHAEHIFGIYGSEDGLFTPDVLVDIQANLIRNPSINRFQLISGASHAIYIDQQDKFIEAVENALK